jgi:hypothetical protein
MTTPDLFAAVPNIHESEITEARAARDKALAKVMANAGQDWQDRALRGLRLYAQTHREFIAEDFRLRWITFDGYQQPHHHNAWGALFRIAAQQGWLEMTNTIRSMSTVRSHARKSPVWRYKEGA